MNPTQTMLASIVTSNPDSVWRLTADGIIVEVLEGADGPYPLGPDAARHHLRDLFPEDIATRCLHAIGKVQQDDSVVVVTLAQAATGNTADKTFEARFVGADEHQVLAFVRNVTEQDRIASALGGESLHDPLTGLATRVLLYDRLAHALRRAWRDGGAIAVLILDLDRFKDLNDLLGLDAGDKLLISVAQSLKESLNEGDTVARLGGDEFAILADGLDDASGVLSLAERLAAAVRTSTLVHRGDNPISTSIGVAVAIGGDAEAATMMSNAETAMFHAKQVGRGHIELFDSELQRRLERRLDLESAIRIAIEKDDFEVHYQPIIDVASGEITGVESLLRWDRRYHGLVSAADFIPIAEETGLIKPLGTWALRRACSDMVAWQQAGMSLNLAVNISATQLVDPGFVELVTETLAETGFDPLNLTIEVNESAVLGNDDTAAKNLAAVRESGTQVALDDFGTGYSSLNHLRRLPITHLKIDRSFTAGLTTNALDPKIIESTIALAHAIGHGVIAEGVETVDQLDMLREFGCDEAQGYYLGKPQSSAEIVRTVTTHLSACESQ